MTDSFKFNLILLSVIILLTYVMFGETLHKKFSIIDDHHIVADIGSDNKFTLNEAINVFKNDKDFDLGEYGRFRPAFQVARALEMYLFKNNLIYYQIARLLVFIFVIYMLSKFIFSKVDVISGSLISLVLVSEVAWFDIISRFVASEIYTLYGLVIFIPVSKLIYDYLRSGNESKLRARTVVLIAYFVSGLLAIGSKENFTFLIIVPAIIFYFLLKSTARGIFKNLIGLISIVLILYGLFISFVIGWYFINTSEDISGYGFHGSTSFKILYNFLKIIFLEWGGVLLIFPPIILLMLKNKLIIKQKYLLLKKDLLMMYSFIFVLYLLLFYQVVYYSGGLPSDSRYDFPTIIFVSAYLLILVFYLKKTSGVLLKKKHANRLLFILLIAIFITKNPIEHIYINYKSSKRHVSHTEHYYSTIEKIKAISSINATKPIIISSFTVWDFELIASFYKFLRANDVNNPLYLKLNYDILDYESSVERDFVQRLVEISKGRSLKNNPDWVPSQHVLQFAYESIDNLKVVNYECILVNINKKKDDDLCKYIIDYNYTGR